MTLAVKWAELGPSRNDSSLAATATINGLGPSSRTRSIVTSFDDVETALGQCVGYSSLETMTISGSGTAPDYLKREIPELFPGESEFVCLNADHYQSDTFMGRKIWNAIAGTWGALSKIFGADPIGTTDQKRNWYNKARIKLNYSNIEYNSTMTDAQLAATPEGKRAEYLRFCTLREDRSAKYFNIPSGFMHVIPVGGGATTPLNYPIGKVECSGTIHIKWHQVAYEALPFNTINSAIGKVSKTAFTFSGKTYPAGTLLVMPPKLETYTMKNRKKGCNIEFVFSEFAEGFNVILNKQAGELVYCWVVSDDTITTPPTPGSLPAKKTLYSEMELKDLWDVSKG